MAHFRAVIKGTRGEASRLGDKKNGMYVKLQSWGWDVVVNAHHDDLYETDWATVELVNHSTGEKLQIAKLNLTTGYSVEREARTDLGPDFFPCCAAPRDMGHMEGCPNSPERKPFSPRTGQLCSCHPGIERDNCPRCEGAGTVIDFAAIRARNSKR